MLGVLEIVSGRATGKALAAHYWGHSLGLQLRMRGTVGRRTDRELLCQRWRVLVGELHTPHVLTLERWGKSRRDLRPVSDTAHVPSSALPMIEEVPEDDDI
ncbi:hypothetical protein K438DRAFT_1947806 [Mycena galopus ATCC 62051]|nr:hypothetical protein K438DRAFT_1947806 [Mycena galopus ATCC 62051]